MIRLSEEYLLIDKKQMLDDTFIYVLKPASGSNVPSFLPGQYTFLKNPRYKDPAEAHPFSIASSPLHNEALEFCIKTYGDWTQDLTHLKPGQSIYADKPRGNFTWDISISNTVFLLGGIGISPVMSMLRYIEKKAPGRKITMLYGNRTPQTVAYKKELESMQKTLADFSLIHIYSHINESHPWKGYRGFITEDIVKNEIKFDNEPTFFVVGPTIFVNKMLSMLEKQKVGKKNIRIEDLSVV